MMFMLLDSDDDFLMISFVLLLLQLDFMRRVKPIEHLAGRA